MSTPEPVIPAAEASISATRARLEDTLDAIEDKLNVPKQAGRMARKARASYEDNPVPWIIGATAAVIVVGGLVAWALFGDD
jgi:hypothetical protein